MITLEEYDRIQVLLGRKGKPRKKVHEFAYTGIIHCGECQCSVSADLKKKIIKTTGKPAEYTYYRCTHKKPSYKCEQPAIEVKELEKQIDDKLAQYDFNPKFRDLLFKMIDEDKKNNPDEIKILVANLEANIQKIKIEKSNLTKMSCKNLIPEEEFTAQRNEYELELVRLTQKIEEIKKQNGAKDEIIDDVKFALQARANFKNATLKDKKEILLRLGSNQQLIDRKLFIQEKKWLVKTATMLKPLEQKFVTLELGKKPLTTHKSEHYNSLLCAMRRGRDSPLWGVNFSSHSDFQFGGESRTMSELKLLLC